jgi:ABC-2 type transport system permease protein
MKALLKLTATELKLQFREPMAMIFTLAFPVFLMIIFGAVFGNDPEASMGGYGQIDLSLPGYIGMIVGTVGMLGIPMTLANYRDNGVLRRLSATPVRASSILWAQVVTQVVLTLAGVALLLVVGMLLFDVRVPAGGMAIIPAAIVGGLSFFAIGFVLAGVLPNARTAQAVGMAIFYPMLFLSGAAMPRSLMPDAVKRISELMPLTHVVKLMEDLWIAGSLNTVSLAVVLALLVGGVLLARVTFRWE